jgi:hypothetical protein
MIILVSKDAFRKDRDTVNLFFWCNIPDPEAGHCESIYFLGVTFQTLKLLIFLEIPRRNN